MPDKCETLSASAAVVVSRHRVWFDRMLPSNSELALVTLDDGRVLLYCGGAVDELKEDDLRVLREALGRLLDEGLTDAG